MVTALLEYLDPRFYTCLVFALYLCHCNSIAIQTIKRHCYDDQPIYTPIFKLFQYLVYPSVLTGHSSLLCGKAGKKNSTNCLLCLDCFDKAVGKTTTPSGLCCLLSKQSEAKSAERDGLIRASSMQHIQHCEFNYIMCVCRCVCVLCCVCVLQRSAL